MVKKHLKYGELKKLGFCVRCKKNNPTPESPFCPVCNEKVKQRRKDDREWFKKNGICVKCQKEKAVSGKTMCLNCADKQAIESAESRAKLSEDVKTQRNNKAKENIAKLKARRIEEGLCVRCGKRKFAATSKRLCDICLEKHRKQSKEYHEKQMQKLGIKSYNQRKAEGLCFWCGEWYEPNGTRACNKCRERARQNTKNNKNENWLEWQRVENNRLWKKLTKVRR